MSNTYGKRLQNSKNPGGLSIPTLTATRSATDFEIMQQAHIEQLKDELDNKDRQLAEAQAEIKSLKKERTMVAIQAHCMMEEKDNEFVLQRRELEAARAEIERLSFRDGNAKHELVYDDGDNPFARERLEYVDFGACDNQYVLESHLLNNTLERVKAKDKLIEQMREALKTLRKYPNTYIATGQGGGIAENDLAMCDAALVAEGGN